MPIDLSVIGRTAEPGERTWTSTDSLLYSIGVGAGLGDPTSELEFTTENSEGIVQRALPSQIGVLARSGRVDLGPVNYARMVHGEQAFELHRPVPVAGTVQTVSTVVDVLDRGSGAVVVNEATVTDTSTDEALATIRRSSFFRGEGGFGGPNPADEAWELPTGAPDYEVSYLTRPEQALLYRLTGDRNPLHVDPRYAAKGGFDTPILHGMCTYGFTGRALLHTIAGGDPDRFRSMAGRFSRPVWPGDTLTISVWTDGPNARFQTKRQDGTVVIDRGTASVRS